MEITEDEIDAMLTRKGFDPDSFVTRRENEAMLKAFGIQLAAKTQAKIAATRDDGPPYTILFGRALMRPRDSLRWAFSRASKPRRASYESEGYSLGSRSSSSAVPRQVGSRGDAVRSARGRG